jgi:hypothetical protein
MKWHVLLLCLAACSLLILPCSAVPTCKNGTTIFITPTPAPPGPDGTIVIESTPAGANIYLNGEAQGRSPLTISGLWPGTYEVTARMNGYATFTSVTTISGPTRSAIYCQLIPEISGSGLVIISTPEKATVFVDGAEKGVTPLAISNPATGPHSIQLRLSGYDTWESSIDIRDRTPKIVSATLKEKAVNTDQGINVSSSPAGATVTLDGREKGFTPVSLYSLAAGIHVIQLDFPGYNSWKSTIDVPENGMKDLLVTLVPKPGISPGWITVSSGPGNASATVDGKYAGRTPLNGSVTLDAVAAGEHTIVLELTGYKPYTTQVNVSPNLISTVNAVLVPSFARGTLSVTSDPAGADISVDNKSLGISPLTAQDIKAGYHMVTMKKEGYQDYSASFHITAGETSSVTATLLPVPSSVPSPLHPLTVLGALGIIGFFMVRKPG